MKILLFALIVTTQISAETKSSNRILPITKEDEIAQEEQARHAKEKLKMLDEENCDEKAKKKVEIKPESISLTGNAGCSLDDAH